jgi:redox-sensitive bicupin YhaK (pirin superfamily)
VQLNLLDDGIDRYLGISLRDAEEMVVDPLLEFEACYGPIVMNTQEQLQRAFEELREGRFLNPRT